MFNLLIHRCRLHNYLSTCRCSCGKRCVEMTSVETCMDLRYKFHGAPDDPVKSNHSRTAAMLELLKIAFQAHSQCFVFAILDIGSRKSREVCEHSFLALHGLLSSKLEKPSMWKNMKAALRRGNLGAEELRLQKEAIRLKSDARCPCFHHIIC